MDHNKIHHKNFSVAPTYQIPHKSIPQFPGWSLRPVGYFTKAEEVPCEPRVKNAEQLFLTIAKPKIQNRNILTNHIG
jgi:hypothetical protein